MSQPHPYDACDEYTWIAYCDDCDLEKKCERLRGERYRCESCTNGTTEENN